MLLLCPDSPVGKWNERDQRIQENLKSLGIDSTVSTGGVCTPTDSADEEKGLPKDPSSMATTTMQLSRVEAFELAQGEVVVKPSMKEAMSVLFSPQCLFHVMTYGCSFGGELAINSVLSSYYKLNFPHLDQTSASNYAAIFGFLNFVTRPLGGVFADVLYNQFGRRLWLKKGWITACGLLTGVLLVIIGQLDPSEKNGMSIGTMVGLVALMAVFHEAGNGANFALVPHVSPHANGIVSGVTGAGGNLGGIVFAIIFRFMDHGKGYAKAFWIIGVMHIALNLAVCWIPPLPKGQLGGR
jgi:NNP family nitrate/nitrite transporter-like MFS transporter